MNIVEQNQSVWGHVRKPRLRHLPTPEVVIIYEHEVDGSVGPSFRLLDRVPFQDLDLADGIRADDVSEVRVEDRDQVVMEDVAVDVLFHRGPLLLIRHPAGEEIHAVELRPREERGRSEVPAGLASEGP